jgi:hypothetical protein
MVSQKLEAPATPAPLLVDLKSAAKILGVTPFCVRNCCWHDEQRQILKPVRHGQKYLFSPAALADFAAKLVSGEIEFPATPVKRRAA